MAFSYDQIFAADPANPSNIAQNAAVTIFAPGDATMTPLAITDPDGTPLPNPIPVNANGFGSAFAHATLDRVAWAGGGFTGFFTSYEGMKQVALDAQSAAESAAATAGAEAAAVADAAIAGATDEATAAAASAATAATNAASSATAAANAAALVGAPADTAIAAAVNNNASATKAALNATYATVGSFAPKAANVRPSRKDGALGLFDAAKLLRTTQPVRVVFLGSSTTAGFGVGATENYVYKLMQKIQAAYPNGGTESSIGTMDSAKITTPGFHAYNGGVGGNESLYYFTGANVTKLAAIDPMIVVHMIGSNDYANGVSPASYKTNVETAIAAVRANTTGPRLNVLAHQHRRLDVASPAYPWTAYRDVLADIADANSDCALVNLGESMDPIIGTTDRFDFLQADNIHLQAQGHTLLSELFFTALSPASGVASAGSSPASLQLSRLTSDIASGANATDINGRATDARLGGVTRTWAADPALSVGITSNAFVRGTNTAAFAANLPEYVMDVEISFTITTKPTGTDMLIVDLHRQGAAVSGTPDAYRMWLYPGGTVDIGKRLAGAQPVLAGGGTYAAGDRISFRYYKGKIEARKNGTLILSATDATITAPGFAGFAGSTNTGWAVKDVTLDAVG